MKKGTILSVGIIINVISLCFMPTIVGNPQSVTLTLNPTDDTCIIHRSGQTNQNRNDYDFMETENQYGGSGIWGEDSLIKFDFSTIRSDVTIKSASIKLYYYSWSTNNPAGRDLNIYRITSDWNEDTVTWDTQPSYTSQPTAYATVPASAGVWMSWDVTSDVQSFIDGTSTNYGWKLTDENYWGGGNIPVTSFRTKEYGSYIPYLEIEYSDTKQQKVQWISLFKEWSVVIALVLLFFIILIISRIAIVKRKRTKIQIEQKKKEIKDTINNITKK